MKESRLEKQLRKEVEDLGGWALKFVPDYKNGMPDRIVLIPKGECYFVELKAPGENLRPLQKKRKRQLRNLGFSHYTLKDDKDLKRFIYRLRRDSGIIKEDKNVSIVRDIFKNVSFNMAMDSTDWAFNETTAYIHSIFRGYDDEKSKKLKEKFKWSQEKVKEIENFRRVAERVKGGDLFNV